MTSGMTVVNQRAFLDQYSDKCGEPKNNQCGDPKCGEPKNHQSGEPKRHHSLAHRKRLHSGASRLFGKFLADPARAIWHMIDNWPNCLASGQIAWQAAKLNLVGKWPSCLAIGQVAWQLAKLLPKWPRTARSGGKSVEDGSEWFQLFGKPPRTKINLYLFVFVCFLFSRKRNKT